jgi:uncharacterized CHY-type Zn-finger protein
MTSKPMSDGGKGSVRRNEDNEAYRDNYDAIFNKGKTKMNEDNWHDYDEDDDEVLCSVCNTEMSITDAGYHWHCDVCGHNERVERDEDY